MAIRPISPHKRPSYFMVFQNMETIFFISREQITKNQSSADFFSLIGFKNNSHIAYTAGFNF